MGSNTALAMQAQVLHRLLTHNAKLLAKNTAALKEWQIGPSSHPSFLPIQAAILELAIADSVSLTAATSSNAQRKITHSALLMKLVKRVQMVLEDAALLQNAADSSGTGEDDGTGKEIVEEEEEEPELQTITTSFAMELLSDISDLIDDNASARSTQEISISDASEDSSLNMSKPQFVKSLLKALRICVENSRKAEKRYLQARINHLETEQAKLEAEKALQSMTTELDQLNSVHAETEEELASERRTAEQLTTENILLVQAHELRARQQGMEMRDSVSSSQPPNSQDSASASRKRKSRWHHFLDLPSWGLQLPPGRARAAARLPTVEVTLPEGEDVLAVFSQDSLGHILGVSRHSIFARVGQDTHPFGAMYGITDYLLTILEEHPWAPTCPGQHGYVVVGLRGEKDLFKDGQCKHLFAGVGKQYHYCGWYKMIIDEPLGPDEWVMLPPTVTFCSYWSVLSSN
ncbi:hypothetical protein C8Q74DRAFT_1023511 [Fomes fomentarius]|nr:hypothetical protein C8Q74DRAFT_1023511 [Fomes fomentarius]